MFKIPKGQDAWNFFFSMLYLVIFAIVWWFLTDGFEWVRWVLALTAFDIIIMSLATFRVVRLVSYDKIFSFFRLQFMDESASGLVKPQNGFRRAVAELLECPWCTGLWAALVISTIYLFAPIGRFFVILMAIAGLGTFLQVLSGLISRAAR